MQHFQIDGNCVKTYKILIKIDKKLLKVYLINNNRET